MYLVYASKQLEMESTFEEQWVENQTEIMCIYAENSQFEMQTSSVVLCHKSSCNTPVINFVVKNVGTFIIVPPPVKIIATRSWACTANFVPKLLPPRRANVDTKQNNIWVGVRTSIWCVTRVGPGKLWSPPKVP